MQNALKQSAVGSLWDEDPIPLMACVCVALSLCRMLLTRSCDPVTDENSNGQVAHTNVTNTDTSVKAVHPISVGPLSAEEEQVLIHHVHLSPYLAHPIQLDHTPNTRLIMLHSHNTLLDFQYSLWTSISSYWL